MKKNLFTLLIVSLAAITLLHAEGRLIEVTGRVTDEESRPLTGVAVVIRKVSRGDVTDAQGRYSIMAERGDTLSVAYLGYIPQELVVTGRTLDITLIQDKSVLEEEVVVVGYGQRKKVSVTGSISRVAAAPTQSMYLFDNMPNEEYASFGENRFINVGKDPLSTFALEVDGASYSNMRRVINQGRIPEADAIRTEELVNYFSYNYEKPAGNDPLKIGYEVSQCPWNLQHRLVRIGIKAREIPSAKLPASNFVFLIDVSGSMYGPTRLELVKSSLKLLVNNLREEDRVSIVVYAGAAGTVLPATPGSDRQKIREALDNLTAGGSTAGGEGIKLAYNVARKNFIKGGNNRVILCTDGDFNVGISSPEGLESLIEHERKSGVFLTVLGYGMGNYKDNRMQTLAEKGNGNHAYIDNIQEANRVLVSEFGSTMHTVAKDVKLQVEFNPSKVQAYRLVGYESRLLAHEDFNDDTKDAGEIGAGHSVTALYEVVPAGVNSPVVSNVDPLKYQQDEAGKAKAAQASRAGKDYPDLMTVKLRYKAPDSDTSEKIEVAVIDDGRNRPSDDFRFAASVAMFGQLLRGSDFKGTATYDDVIELAETGLSNDGNGYRREFVRLVKAAKGMEYQRAEL